MTDQTTWPAWATAKIDDLSRADARNCLVSAQAFWRDFALAGLSIADLKEVIEERRRLGPRGRIVVTAKQIRENPPVARTSCAISASEIDAWLATLPQVPHA